MIAYEILVQTIADWKAGVRPSAPVPPAAAAAPEVVEEYNSGVVDLEEEYGQQYGEQQYGGEQQYDEQQYGGEPQYEYQDDEQEEE